MVKTVLKFFRIAGKKLLRLARCRTLCSHTDHFDQQDCLYHYNRYLSQQYLSYFSHNQVYPLNAMRNIHQFFLKSMNLNSQHYSLILYYPKVKTSLETLLNWRFIFDLNASSQKFCCFFHLYFWETLSLLDTHCMIILDSIACGKMQHLMLYFRLFMSLPSLTRQK